MVNYNKLEDQLFSKWDDGKHPFISDGVVNNSIFNKLNFKIAYLLKEVNDKSNNGNWDLRNFIAEFAYKRSPTWNNIAAWTYGILNVIESGNAPKWQSVLDTLQNEKEKINLLNKICSFNLKKIPGGHTAINSEINKYVKSNSDLLKEQLQIYSNVDLIICCGTPVGSLSRKYLFNNFFNWDSTTRGIWFKKVSKSQTVIYYNHPNARIDSNLLFYGLIDAVEEIYKNNTTHNRS